MENLHYNCVRYFTNVATVFTDLVEVVSNKICSFWKLKTKINPLGNSLPLGVFYLKVYSFCLKTNKNMSNIKISFLGYDDNPPSGLKEITASFKPNSTFSDFPLENRIQIQIKNSDEGDECKLAINLDLKQAIRFSKTLQHEIYKLKQSEVSNA